MNTGMTPSGSERLQELRLAQNLLAGNSHALLMFDEMEDVLERSLGRFGVFKPSVLEASSKVFLHRILETSQVPILWAMNDARNVNPAILRRMMFALELRLPTAPVRARVWSRQLDGHGIEAEPEDVRSLAAEFEAAPGVAAGVTSASSLAGGDLADVRRGVAACPGSCPAGNRPRERSPVLIPG